MSRRNTSFYYAFAVLPRGKREAITAVWDFCRAVDDTVDEAAAGPESPEPALERGRTGAAPVRPEQIALDGWRAELARCYGEGPGAGQPLTLQGRRLQPFVARFNLPRTAFDDLIDGVEMDLHHDRYQTFEALSGYCRRVASTVGLICVEIFGYRDPGARAYAVNLGIALQLTNIIRDLATDWALGRLYLPLDDLARFRCRESDLSSGAMSDRLRNLLAFECARARSFYEKARTSLPSRDARRLVAAEIMREIYFEILQRIERRDYDVLSSKVRVPRRRQVWIAATTWMRTMAGLATPKVHVTSTLRDV